MASEDFNDYTPGAFISITHDSDELTPENIDALCIQLRDHLTNSAAEGQTALCGVVVTVEKKFRKIEMANFLGCAVVGTLSADELPVCVADIAFGIDDDEGAEA